MDKEGNQNPLFLSDSLYVYGERQNMEKGDLLFKLKKQIFRNILNLNKYNPDNLEEEDGTLFFWRDIKS